MIRRRLLVAMTAAMALCACDQQPSLTGPRPKELRFSILATANQASVQALWQPLLDDLSDSVGVRVKPYVATNYTSLVEEMRFGQVQVGWFSAGPALEAVNRADAEVLSQVVDPSGETTYRSVLIARKGSGVTLDDVLACGRKYSFGVGDTESAAGTIAPMTYLFAPRDIEPASCFKTLRPANAQANLIAVAEGVVDVATNNSVGLLFAERESPTLVDRVAVIWSSPPLPESSILVRKDLDPALKEKIRQFFLTYGTGAGPVADRQREVLRRLAYGGFRPADDSYLDPVREMVAAQALSEAKASGDRRRIAAARAQFEKVQASAAQRRAADPDV